jgi:hypothetical protein
MDRLESRVALFDPSMISSATTQSSYLPQLDTQSPWILDSGASFHMTHDSTHLDSMSSLPSRLMCRLFLMYLSFTCRSFLPVKLQIMVVVSFLIQMLVLSMIVAPGSWLVLVVGFVIHLIFGSLTGFIFFQLRLMMSPLLPLLVSPLPPPALLSDITV